MSEQQLDLFPVSGENPGNHQLEPLDMAWYWRSWEITPDMLLAMSNPLPTCPGCGKRLVVSIE